MKSASHQKTHTDEVSYEVPGVAKFIETESRMVVAKGWGRGRGGYCLMSLEFQFCKMKRVLGIGCMTV